MLLERSTAMALLWSNPFPLKVTVKIRTPEGSSFVTKTSVVVAVTARLPVTYVLPLASVVIAATLYGNSSAMEVV